MVVTHCVRDKETYANQWLIVSDSDWLRLSLFVSYIHPQPFSRVSGKPATCPL